MLLAKALQVRKAYAEKLSNLLGQVSDDAVVMLDNAGKAVQPAEDPNKVLLSARELIDEYALLIAQINRTNQETKLDGKFAGMTMAQAVVLRDAYLKHYEHFHQASRSRARAGQVLLLDVRKAKGMAEDIASKARELDEAIQKANWLTELVK